jgi:hypothetical protein
VEDDEATVDGLQMPGWKLNNNQVKSVYRSLLKDFEISGNENGEWSELDFIYEYWPGTRILAEVKG